MKMDFHLINTFSILYEFSSISCTLLIGQTLFSRAETFGNMWEN